MPLGDDGEVNLRRLATVVLSSLATIVGLGAFFFLILALFGSRNALHALIYAAVFLACLWYVVGVMRADRRTRRAAEAALPEELRPARREPRRPITFRVRETAISFVIWATIVAAFSALSGQPLPVIVGASVFAGFMLATLTVTGRHMMFRLTGDEDEEPSARS